MRSARYLSWAWQESLLSSVDVRSWGMSSVCFMTLSNAKKRQVLAISGAFVSHKEVNCGQGNPSSHRFLNR